MRILRLAPFLAVMVVGCRGPSASPTIFQSGAREVVAPTQSGAANLSASDVSGVKSEEGDIKGFEVSPTINSIMPWSLAMLIVAGWISNTRLTRFVVRLSHEREMKRLEKRRIV